MKITMLSGYHLTKRDREMIHYGIENKVFDTEDKGIHVKTKQKKAFIKPLENENTYSVQIENSDRTSNYTVKVV